MERTYLAEQLTATQMIAPQASAAATLTGATIDALASGANLYTDALAVLSIGASANTPTTITIASKLQHSDDNFTTPVDVTGIAQTVTGTNAAMINTVHKLPAYSPRALKRYRRWVSVITFTGGSSPTIISGINELAGAAFHTPVS